MEKLTHVDDKGKGKMVDVSDKSDTKRIAVAKGRVIMSEKTLALLKEGNNKKGDVIGIANIAGIMAAKKTSELIPLCHNINITGIELNFTINEKEFSVEICAQAGSTDKTGVEMEALTAVSVAALTIYDMCKAVDKMMVISDIKLVKKSGGKSGDFIREEIKNER